MADAYCDCCGAIPEVYGSAWCARCHDTIPEDAKRRIIEMRNTLFALAHGFFLKPDEMRRLAQAGLDARWLEAAARPAAGKG